MNILFLTYQGGMAGSTNSISYLARGLADRGHNVYVGCKKSSLLFALLENTNVRPIPMDFKGRLDFSNARAIAAAVKQYDIQLINPQSSYDRYTSFLAKVKYKLKVVIVHTRRQMPQSDGGKLQAWLYTKMSQRIVAVSAAVKQGLVKTGIPENHIKVIYNGTPPEKYDSVSSQPAAISRQQLGAGNDTVILGCISRLKQQEQILEALAFLDKDITMVFVGIEETDRLKSVRQKLSLPQRIIYVGKVTNETSLAYYRLFDIAVLASNMEGLSQSLLEAMALKVPVVATRAAGNIDLIREGENGLLFTEGKPDEIAQCIKRILEDDGLKKRLIEGGVRTAYSDFSIGQTVRNYEKFFQELVDEVF